MHYLMNGSTRNPQTDTLYRIFKVIAGGDEKLTLDLIKRFKPDQYSKLEPFLNNIEDSQYLSKFRGNALAIMILNNLSCKPRSKRYINCHYGPQGLDMLHLLIKDEAIVRYKRELYRTKIKDLSTTSTHIIIDQMKASLHLFNLDNVLTDLASLAYITGEIPLSELPEIKNDITQLCNKLIRIVKKPKEHDEESKPMFFSFSYNTLTPSRGFHSLDKNDF